MRKLRPLILLLVWSAAGTARADLCDVYKKHMPGLYKINCMGGRRSVQSNSGSGSASVSDSFNINPASLPTQPSPYGLEVMGSYLRTEPSSSGYNFALIKGFHKIGTGISTNSNNTFFGNDIIQRATGTSDYQTFTPAEPPAGMLPNINLGTSIEILPPQGPIRTSLSMGLSARYNKVTNSLGYGLGYVVNSDYFILGGGFVSENISRYLPEVQFLSGVAGIKLGLVQFEYTILQNLGGYDLGPIHIGTVSTTLGPLIVTAAMRTLEFVREGQVTQTHYAIQWQFSQHLTAGFLVNQIPGTNSVAIQVYL